MKCTLEVISGSISGKNIEISGDSLIIGREKTPGVKSNDLDFDHTLDSKVSRTHAEIIRTTNGFSLNEISGKNNTWINGIRTNNASLRNDDIITLGKDGPSIRVHIEYDKNDHPLNIETASPSKKIHKDVIGRKTLFEIMGLERQKTEKGIKKINKRLYHTWGVIFFVICFSALLGWRGYEVYTDLRNTDDMIQNALTDGDRAIIAEIEELKKRGEATDKNIAALKYGYESLKQALPAMNSVLKEARKSVVRITTVYDIVESGTERKAVYDGKPCRFTSLGSGFCVKENGYIITNAHIASPWLFNPELLENKLSGKRLSISVTFDGEDEPLSAEVKAIDKENDLAILKINKSSCPYIKLSANLPSAGEQVVILGFPALVETGDLRATCMVIGGNVSRVDSNGSILYSMITHSGNSGGPVIMSSGEVAAIHSSGLYSDNGSFFARQGSEDMMVMSSNENEQYRRDPLGTVEVSKIMRLSNEQKGENTKNISRGISANHVRDFIERNI